MGNRLVVSALERRPRYWPLDVGRVRLNFEGAFKLLLK